jgi:hypothetical protein
MTSTNDSQFKFEFCDAEPGFPKCDGMPMQYTDDFSMDCATLMAALQKLQGPTGRDFAGQNTGRDPRQNTDDCWHFDFPGVSDEVSAIYHDSLVAMERWCPIADAFTQPEVNLIVKNIDNKDYVNEMYPGQDVGWHGLLNDNGIFRGIARFKKQHGNPKLFSMLWVCSALSTPMPKHLYYLFFKSANGETLKMSYRSGDDVLMNIP